MLLPRHPKKRIAILGMGFAGLSLGYFLLESQSIDVTLFDHHPQGAGASSVSAGLLHPYPGADAYLAKDAQEGFHATRKLLEVAGRTLERPIAQQSGLLRLAMSPKQRAAFLERAQQHSDIAFLTEEQMAQRVPQAPACAGLWISQAITVDVEGYLEGLRTVCLNEGAHYVQQHVEAGDGWHGLNISPEFDAVVLAMGAESRGLPHMAPFALSVIKGQIIELAYPQELPALACPMTGDCYIIPKNGRCLVGATFEKQFTSALPDRAQAEALLRPRLEAMLPQLHAARCLDVRAGLRLTTPQHRPLAQQIDKRVWVFTALGSKGLLHHALMGQKLSQTIVESL